MSEDEDYYVLLRTHDGVFAGRYLGRRPHDGAYILSTGNGHRRRYIPEDVFVSMVDAPHLKDVIR